MANKKHQTVPQVLLPNDTGKLDWFRDIRTLSIGELIEKYAYAEAIVETVREPLLILDSKLRVQSANKSFFDTFQVTKSAVYGKHIYDINSREWDIPELRQLLEEILPHNKFFNDFEVRHHFGQTGNKIMLLNARRIELEENQTQLILLAIEDVTDKRTVERQKDEFISNVSHELKSPLTSMKTYIEMAQKLFEKKATKQESHILAKINVQTDKLISMINELLQLSQNEPKGESLQKAPTDLDALIDNVLMDFRETYSQFSFERQGRLQSPVRCDEGRIEQVLINLLTNATKYSPKTKRIIIQAKNDNGKVVIGVQDFGEGIALKDQPHIFKRYYRSKAKKDSGIQGFGLGLYISANIIHLHNGKIWFTSTPGKGSTFYFSLPASRSHLA